MSQFGTVAVLVVVLSAAGPSHLWANGLTVQSSFEDGVSAYDKGDYQRALSIWLPLAEDGDHNAQFNVALIYFNGLAVDKDEHLAFEWFSKAADAGYLKAQSILGTMYFHGQGVTQDDHPSHEPADLTGPFRRRLQVFPVPNPVADRRGGAIGQRT